MSCLDVMYHQTYGAHHYLPAAAYRAACLHRHQQQKKVGTSSKMQDPVDPIAQLTQGKEQKRRREEERGGAAGLGAPAKEAPPAEAEYLSSRCVLFTYFQGNIGDVVDEHFSRALGQSSTLTEDRKRGRTPPGGMWKDGASLSTSQCTGFPSSFWGSSHTQQGSPFLSSVHPDFPPGTAFHSGDPATWAGHTLHQPGLPPPATLPDSWHYALGAQGGSSYPHVHEVYPHMHARHGHTHHMLHHAHGATLDPRFSPLLLSSVHPTCSPTTHCDGAKAELEASSAPAHNWPGSFHGTVDIFDAALDQDKGKASVWF